MPTTAAATGRTDVGRLHVLTPELGGEALVRFVATAAEAGAPTVQLRTKRLSDRERFDTASAATAICRDAGVRLIVNDRADVAIAAGADGVHLGTDDLPVPSVARLVGPQMIVGATARDPDSGRAAQAAGATYLGVGPAYATASKTGLPDPRGPEGIAAVVAAVDLPVIAIGGITPDRVPDLLRAGAHGVAVLGAIGHAADPAAAIGEFLAALDGHERDRATP